MTNQSAVAGEIPAAAERIAETDDRRAENTPGYRVLTPHEKDLVSAVKRLEQHFTTQLRFIAGMPDGDTRFPSRELSLAYTKIQEASMWATKHITS
jgi:hypothetical protein